MAEHHAHDPDDAHDAIEPTARSDVVRRRHDDELAFAIPKTAAEAILDGDDHGLLPPGRCAPASDDLLAALIDAFADTPRDPGRATMRREIAGRLREIRANDVPLYVERIAR